MTLLFGEVSFGIWAAFLKDFWDVLGGSELETVPGTNLAENRPRNDFRNGSETTQKRQKWANFPSLASPIIDAPSHIQLVGHSMGGSVITRSCPILQQKSYKIGGVAVLDVVEGTRDLYPKHSSYT
jgi:hypothetical protein